MLETDCAFMIFAFIVLPTHWPDWSLNVIFAQFSKSVVLISYEHVANNVNGLFTLLLASNDVNPCPAELLNRTNPDNSIALVPRDKIEAFRAQLKFWGFTLYLPYINIEV